MLRRIAHHLVGELLNLLNELVPDEPHTTLSMQSNPRCVRQQIGLALVQGRTPEPHTRPRSTWSPHAFGSP